MSEPTINFNNNAGAVINGHMGIVHGNLYFGKAATENLTAGANENADAECDESVKSTGRDKDVDE